jgi:hypothetical protein
MTMTVGLLDLVNIADFIFMVVIGCIRSRDPMPNYTALFGEKSTRPARPAGNRPTLQRPVPSGYRGDEYDSGAAPAAEGNPGGGFGRKRV